LRQSKVPLKEISSKPRAKSEAPRGSAVVEEEQANEGAIKITN
jgi:hypothetical protein